MKYLVIFNNLYVFLQSYFYLNLLIVLSGQYHVFGLSIDYIFLRKSVAQNNCMF